MEKIYNQDTCERSSSDDSNAELTENEEIRTNSMDSSDHSDGPTSSSESENETVQIQKTKKLTKATNFKISDINEPTRISTRDRQRPERFGYLTK